MKSYGKNMTVAVADLSRISKIYTIIFTDLRRRR
jgi:hypothetical protein